MNNERDDWAQASETVLIFDQWMRAIVGTLRAERGATINQFWLLLLISERPQQSAATAAATLGATTPRWPPAPLSSCGREPLRSEPATMTTDTPLSP